MNRPPMTIEDRLVRIETKLIRGFEELGADTNTDPDWLTVIGDTIEVTTIGRSLKVIIQTAKKKGAKIGQRQYVLVHNGRDVAWL